MAVTEIIAYEMEFTGLLRQSLDAEDLTKETFENGTCRITCIPFQPEFFEEYKAVYNACFYDMRKALDVKPYAFYSEYAQIQGKENDIFLYIKDGELAGSVACYGNEIDDLIVNKAFQGQGYGRQLLLWAMEHIRENSQEPITLHVAEWNQHALRLYEDVGFSVKKREKIR